MLTRSLRCILILSFTFVITLLPLAQFSVHAAENLPDLIVTDITYTPAQPFAGDAVRISAVVKNQGTAATPVNTVIGGVFFVDGNFASFTDTNRTSLPPGASVTLTANGGGPFGDGTWYAAAGPHILSFLVDDVNRIPESDENNNTFELSQPIDVSVEDGSDLIVSQVTWKPAELSGYSYQPILFTSVITNRGTQPTPEEKSIKLLVKVDGKTLFLGGTSNSALASGQSTTLRGGLWLAKKGIHTVEATVDPGNSLQETHENNNALAIQFAYGVDWSATSQSTETFVNSVGVATHLSYTDTLYGEYDTVVKPLLLGLGIRYIRDGSPYELDRAIDLGQNGIRIDYIMNPNTPPAEELASIQSLTPYLASIEGPNEPDFFARNLFPVGIQNYQQQMYSAVKANPATASLPVIAPSLAFGASNATFLGPVPCDRGNLHNYESYPTIRLQENINAAKIVCPNQKLWVTETGYHNVVKNGGTSEQATAKYLLRTYLENFNAGIERTFAYEFLDEKPDPNFTDAEQHFGMVHNDGTPKPSYISLKNMLTLLKGSTSSFTPNALNYTVSGNISNLHRVLLQKSDGRFYLALWANVPSFGAGGKDLNVPTQNVTLHFNQPIKNANLYQPNTSASPTTVNLNHQELTLSVGDAPLVLELKPAQ